MAHETTPEADLTEIWLDGRPFYVEGGINQDIVNIFARKVNQGDPTADDHPIFSTSVQNSWAGGWMVSEQNPATDQDDFWTSTCETQYPGALTLPTDCVHLAAPDGETENPFVLGDYQQGVMVSWGTNLYRYNPVTRVPLFIGDMGSSATNTGRIFRAQGESPGDPPGSTYFWIPLVGGYCMVDGGGDIIGGTSVETCVALENWDQKLWRLDADGSLYWVHVVPTIEADWTYDCCLVDGSTPKNLLSYIRMDREPCLVVVTSGGIWKHDFTSHVLHEEDLWYPSVPYHGDASLKYRTDILIAAGTGIYTYDNNTISPDNGLDGRHGLPSEYRGHIKSMASGLNDFYALIQGVTVASEGEDDTIELQLGMVDTWEFSSQNAANLLLRNNGFGWHYIWHGQGGTANNVLTSNVGGIYGLWWGAGNQLHFVQLPATYYAPDDHEAVRMPVRPQCSHISSWIDWGWEGQPKILKFLELDVDNMQWDGNLITVWYQIDREENPWIKAGDIIGPGARDGEYRWFMGQDAEHPTIRGGRGHYKGLRHEQFRWKIDITCGPNRMQPPWVKRHTATCRKWLRPQLNWRGTLNIQEKHKDWTIEQQIAFLKALAEAQEAVIFLHQDREWMVEMTVQNWGEGKGRDKRATCQISLVETFEKSLELEAQ